MIGGETNPKPRPLLAAAATLVLLGGIVGMRAALRVDVGDAAGYQAGVKTVADTLPTRIGPWFGSDVAVPTQAVDLLRPNVLVSRRYENIITGQSFTFLLVQTRDARDLLGHYPPICYPARGFVQQSDEAKRWPVNLGPQRSVAVDGRRYAFSLSSAAGEQRIEVVNFMLAPDGSVAPDMYALEKHLTDRRRTHYGAAEVQLVFPPTIPPAEQDAVAAEVIEASRPVLDAILAGYEK